MKKWHYCIIGALLILIITNPGVKAFEDYLGVNTYSGLRRTSNFFIFSFYKSDDYYFAMAGNFFHLKKSKPPFNLNRGYSDTDTTLKADTAMRPLPKGYKAVADTAWPNPLK